MLKALGKLKGQPISCALGVMVAKDGLRGNGDLAGRGTSCRKTWPCEATWNVQAAAGNSVLLENKMAGGGVAIGETDESKTCWVPQAVLKTRFILR